MYLHSYCCLGSWRPLAPKVLSALLDADLDQGLTCFTARQIYLKVEVEYFSDHYLATVVDVLMPA